jgi:hypothetical protein
MQASLCAQQHEANQSKSALKGVWVSRQEVEQKLALEQQQRLITAGISGTLIDVMYEKGSKLEQRERVEYVFASCTRSYAAL